VCDDAGDSFTGEARMDTANLTSLQRRQLFVSRKKVRDITRAAYIENCGDPEKTQRQAEAEVKSQYGSIIASILLAIMVNLVAGWIADFIRDWLSRGVKIPPVNYQPNEPGYMPEFEDDES
jgi:hypothetical protein